LSTSKNYNFTTIFNNLSINLAILKTLEAVYQSYYNRT